MFVGPYGLGHKKGTLFYGRTDFPSRVGRFRHFFFFNLFSFCWQKWRPKTLKSQHKNLTFFFFLSFFFFFFFRKLLEKYFHLSSKYFSQIFFNFGRNGWFYMILSNKKKQKKEILPKWKTWVDRARKTGFSFFFFHDLSTIVCALRSFGHQGALYYAFLPSDPLKTSREYAVFTLRTRGPKVCTRETSCQTQTACAFLFWLRKWSHYFIHHGTSWRPWQNFIMFYEKRKV